MEHKITIIITLESEKGRCAQHRKLESWSEEEAFDLVRYNAGQMIELCIKARKEDIESPHL